MVHYLRVYDIVGFIKLFNHQLKMPVSKINTYQTYLVIPQNYIVLIISMIIIMYVINSSDCVSHTKSIEDN